MLQLLGIALHLVVPGIERANQMDFSHFELVLHEPKRVLDHFMQADDGKRRLGRSRELQELVDERIDPFGLAADQTGHFDILIPLREEVGERFDGDQRVFDFVRHAGRQGADTGQSFEPADATLQFPGRIEIVKHRDHHQRLS